MESNEEKCQLQAMAEAGERFLDALARRDWSGVQDATEQIELARVAFRRAERKRRREERKQ